MYKKLVSVIFISAFLLIFQAPVYAHPIDNTDTYFYLEKEIDGLSIDESHVKMYSYINWFQASLLVEKQLGIVASDVIELLKYQNIYNEYVKNNIRISNNGELCKVEIDESPVTEEQLSLSLGTRVIGTYVCSSKIENIKIENDLFLTDFEFESNFTSIYSGELLLHGITLDRNTSAYEFNIQELKQNPKGDQTKDNSADLSTDEVTTDVPSELRTQADTNIDNAGPKKRSFLTTLTDSLFLRTNSIKDQSIPILFLLVFLLGFLHTVEAGHSKAILASTMLHNKMDLKKGLVYATIFTVTHLGDIIIVGLILLAADNYFNLLSNFSMIEKFAGYALFFMSIYMLLKNAQYFIRKWTSKNKNIEMHDHVHFETSIDVSFKDQLLLGFLAGLAPCVFGWSIFMLILSTNKIWVLVPAILFFGLGIFVALACVVFLLTHLKKGAYSRFEKIAEISPLISAIFLMIYAVFLIL